MTVSHDRGSAEIFQFPPRGRFAASARDDQSKPAARLASPRLAAIAFGDNWYHEQAIEEAGRARKS